MPLKELWRRFLLVLFFIRAPRDSGRGDFRFRTLDSENPHICMQLASLGSTLAQRAVRRLGLKSRRPGLHLVHRVDRGMGTVDEAVKDGIVLGIKPTMSIVGKTTPNEIP